ncbi:hypothetical protein D6783_03440 [Candidatus Woesearchaeota archaeon]|nr:MAG: hypothetical protein D6783_03440 [Candidatus Woesearchaeota archaeon]
MESVELLVFLIVAIIAASMIYWFLVEHDWQNTSETIENLVQKEKNEPAFTQTKQEFTTSLYRIWESCEFGRKNMTVAVHIKDEGNLTKDDVLNGVRLSDHEDDLKQQDLNMADLTIPRVVLVTCANGTLTIT